MFRAVYIYGVTIAIFFHVIPAKAGIQFVLSCPKGGKSKQAARCAEG
jgi:hypothetical protein